MTASPKSESVAWTGLTAGLLIVLLQLVFAAGASAQTADGMTPAEELVCDGLQGREFGLCNAYCEAMDCDTSKSPQNACESLRDNYFEQTGLTTFPCDATCPDLPDVWCSGNGWVDTDAGGCDVCLCIENFAGPDCATCTVGFDECGDCGGPGGPCDD